MTYRRNLIPCILKQEALNLTVQDVSNKFHSQISQANLHFSKSSENFSLLISKMENNYSFFEN